MKTEMVERQVFEKWDVIELTGKDLPNAILRDTLLKDRDGLKPQRFIIIEMKKKWDGALTAKVVSADLKKYTIDDDKLEKAKYIGNVDLHLFEIEV